VARNKRNRADELAALNDNKSEIPKDGRIIIPTGDRRHMSHIRNGKISSEVFSKERLRTLPVDSGE